MSSFKTAALAAVIFLLSAGCANQNAQMHRGDVYDTNKAYSADLVSFVDKMDVLVNSLTSTHEGKFLKVAVEFINAGSDEDNSFVYKIEWFDKDRIAVGQTSWQPIRIRGNQKIMSTNMANVPSAVTYKVVIATHE